MDPGPRLWQESLIKHAILETHTYTKRHTHMLLSNLNKHKHTPVGFQSVARDLRREQLAYLAISDLLSRPECRMTARERPERLETCLHLCISHINKFSHCCIQTRLPALLHTTHSCHKHSDTQSTTTERKRAGRRRGRAEREREKKKKSVCVCR